jgi:hypothetical protein
MVEIPLQQSNHRCRTDIILRPASGWGTGVQIVTRDLGNRCAPTPFQPIVDTSRRAQVMTHRPSRVSFANQELREPVQRRPKNGKGRVATMNLREYLFEHRDLLG